MSLRVPSAEAAYLAEVVRRLRDLLGDNLLAVYPTGSLALDGYTPGRSDVDLMAVVEAAPEAELLRRTAARLDHAELPCPAAGLEFVLYPRSVAAGGRTGAGYLLDLNTGRELPAKASLDPGDGPGFWYAIDRSVTRQADLALAGPPPHDLLRPAPAADLLPVVVESVRAHRTTGPENADNAVLNAARAWCFGTRGRWYAKPAAGRHAARDVPAFAELIHAALASHAAGRRPGRPLPEREVATFLGYVADRLAA